MVSSKKVLSLILLFAMLISMIPTVLASDKSTDQMLTVSEEQFIEQNYEKYTVTLESNQVSDAIDLHSTTSLRERNYAQAVQFVNSLDFSKYPDVREENLKYLESLYEAGANITSHTVLMPRGVGDDLYNYGTLNGMNYYYKYYATTSYEVLEDRTNGIRILENFISGVIDFCIGKCGGEVVSCSWAVFSQALDILPSYTVQSGDFLEYKVKITATLKGIYTQDLFMIYGMNTAAIVRVYTGEAGAARTYCVYHYGTVTGRPEAAGWIDEPEYISTQDYYNKEAILKLAEDLYFNGGDGHHYLSDVVIRNASLYFS